MANDSGVQVVFATDTSFLVPPDDMLTVNPQRHIGLYQNGVFWVTYTSTLDN